MPSKEEFTERILSGLAERKRKKQDNEDLLAAEERRQKARDARIFQDYRNEKCGKRYVRPSAYHYHDGERRI